MQVDGTDRTPIGEVAKRGSCREDHISHGQRGTTDHDRAGPSRRTLWTQRSGACRSRYVGFLGMGTMGYGYGSEWQLTRMLGRHRGWFTEQVEQVCGVSGVEWLDFEFNEGDWLGDAELKSLQFLPESIQAGFREWWPHGSGIMNWDAVGVGEGPDGSPTWVLLEAKGNIPEMESSTGAGPESLTRIRAVLDETREASWDHR